MTHIKQTEYIHPALIVAAKCHHQAEGCSRIRVPRMYTVSSSRDGSGFREYLLTRYENRLGVAMSSIMEVRPHPSAASGCHLPQDGEGKDIDLVEACREGRKQEEKMIIDWYTRMGGTVCPE